MGRELVQKKIRQSGRTFVIAGAIFALICIWMMWMMLSADNPETEAAILFGICCLIGVLMLIGGIMRIMHPEKTTAVKNNPQLFQMADQLYSHIVYEDKFILLSDQVVANKKDPSQMAWLWDVYLIYLHTTSTNFIPTGSEYVMETRLPKNKLRISVYGKGKESKQNLLNVLAQACPNAAFGYSREGLDYVKRMQQADPYSIPNTPYYTGGQQGTVDGNGGYLREQQRADFQTQTGYSRE